MKGSFEHRFPPEFSQVRILRKALRDQLVKWKIDLGVVDRALLVVDELVSNAIEHGGVHRIVHEPLVLRASLSGTCLALDFEDPEVPPAIVKELQKTFAGDRTALPALDSERGRGLFLIATWLEKIAVSALRGGGMRFEGRIPGARA